MNEDRTDPAAVRRWTIEVGRLRERAAKAKRQRSGPEEETELVEMCLAACQMLLQEFAAAELRVQRTEGDLRAVDTAWHGLFERAPVPCLEVDADGAIVGANTAAGKLLNMSARRLAGRPLLYFFEDRTSVAALLRAAPFERKSPATALTVRPRERAPVRVAATVVGGVDNASVFWWFLMPGEAGLQMARAAEELEQSANPL